MEQVKPIRRLTAYFIDLLLVVVVFSLVINIHFINPHYDKYLESYENYQKLTEKYINQELTEKDFMKQANLAYYDMAKYSVNINIAEIIVVLLYFGLFQKFNKGQTIGKKIMKMKVVNNNKETPSIIQLFIKYTISALPEMGCALTLLLSSILVYVLNANYYLIITVILSSIIMIANIVSYIMIIARKDHRSLVDMICKTNVINEKN